MPPKPDPAMVEKAWQLKRKGLKQREIADDMQVELRTVQNYHSLQWLQKRGLTQLSEEAVTMSQTPQVLMCTVGPVPDVPTRYRNPWGRIPTGVSLTPTAKGVHAPLLFNEATAEFFDLQSPTSHSGVFGNLMASFGFPNSPGQSLSLYEE